MNRISESPQTKHGRVMEAVHISGYSFARACTDLEWLLEDDRWKQCGNGFGDINAFLATVDLSPFKIEASHRKKLAKRLEELQASQRATAKALGVDQSTINKDLRDEKSSIDDLKTLENKEKNGPTDEKSSHKPDSGIDAAKRLEKTAHVSNNSEENEWYTPPKWIEAARKAMGGIDVDPASCDEAQKHIKAKKFFTIADDGLSKVWRGRVWLNPPYSRETCPKFIEKLLLYYREEAVSQACVLVNNATETAWLQDLLKASSAVFFPAGRISFLDRSGKPANKPLQGQLIAYLGERSGSFCEAYESRGAVLLGRPSLDP
jgi:hypothetical protein